MFCREHETSLVFVLGRNLSPEDIEGLFGFKGFFSDTLARCFFSVWVKFVLLIDTPTIGFILRVHRNQEVVFPVTQGSLG
jgi:hypothetical protein